MKMRFNLIFTLVIFLSIAQSVFGQRKIDKDKINSLRVAFVTEKIGLTAEEAKEFWPVYDSYLKEKRSILYEKRKHISDVATDPKNLTDKEAIETFKRQLASEKQMVEAKQDYFNEFNTILGASRALDVMSIEFQFKRKLAQQFAKKHKPAKRAKQYP